MWPGADRCAPGARRLRGGADSVALGCRPRLRGTGRRRQGRGDRGPRPAARFCRPGRAHRRPAARPGADPSSSFRGRSVTTGPEGGPVGALRRPGRRAAEHGARIALGHTLDDQAETVLLGLGRGSGPRSVAGMVEDRPPYWRLLLAVRRETTAGRAPTRGCRSGTTRGTTTRPTRARLRTEVLPLLEDVLGGGVAPALRARRRYPGRTSTLDDLAAGQLARLAAEGGGADGGSPGARTRPTPAALRRRVLRGWPARPACRTCRRSTSARSTRRSPGARLGSTCRAPGASSGRLAGWRSFP